jgi:tight adherence protein C
LDAAHHLAGGPMIGPRRHQDRLAAAFPDAVEVIVVAVRAGHSPTDAVRAAATMSDPCLVPAFAAFEHRLARGASFADALAELGTVVGSSARPIVDVIATADRYGLPLAPALDRVVDEARAERRRHAAHATRRLPVALSFPLVTCSLPAFVLLAVVPAVLGAVASLRTSLP